MQEELNKLDDLIENKETPTATVENLPVVKEDDIKAVEQQINFNDPGLTVTFGAKPMNSIAQFADGLMQEVRAKDAGPAGDILSNLLLQVKTVDLDKFGETNSFLAKIPVIGPMFNTVERNMAHFQKVSDQVQDIASKLDKSMVGLLHDIEVLEQLYGYNKSNYLELTTYIEAGKRRLEEARTVDLVKMQDDAQKSQDGLAAQNVRDFADKLNRFDRRLHDLQISRTVTLQTMPQIRLIQSNNQTLAEKIQTSILTTIPVWKNQIVLAISLNRQKKAVELQQQVSDATNELLLKNAELLHDTTVATAKEAERSIVDFATLKTVHEKLLSTLEESLQIASDGRAKRAEVEGQLKGMEQDLRDRLLELADKKAAQDLTPAEKLVASQQQDKLTK